MKIESVVSKYVLLFISVMFLGALYIIWQAWPLLVMSSMQWQKGVNNELSELLYEAQAHVVSAGLSLALLSFIYGILHSLGPGHGKLIVSTYVATHPTKVKVSLMLTVLSALLQAVVAITLVSVLLVLFNASMKEVNGEANRLISLSFYAIVILGVMIVWRNGKVLYKTFPIKKKALRVNRMTPLTIKRINSIAKNAPKSDTCSCGHVHFASADDINKASSIKEHLAIIFSVGLRPCTGAIMVLLFSSMLDNYWLGILSAFVMAIGTAFTTSIIAIMTVTGKQLVKRYMDIDKGHQHDHDGIGKVGIRRLLTYTSIKLTGGAFLIFIGVVLLSSQPVGLSPMFYQS